MIEFKNICKTYRVTKRQSGFLNAIRAFVSRDYDVVHALKNVSFKIADGEIVGYIGPNGAGKSTTIKIMCGILTPNSGECLINGRIPWKQRIAHVNDIGVVFGQRSQLWWDVPVIDSFELIRDIYKTDAQIYKKNLDKLSELLDLKELLKTPTRNLSLGQRMRCEIASSLLHEPKILFLDEPTIGLDAVSKIAVRKFIKDLNSEYSTTIILTTHDMHDIEALAERIILIGKGEILLDCSLDIFRKKIAHKKKLTVKYKTNIPPICYGMEILESKNCQLTISLDTSIISVSEAIKIIAQQSEINDIFVSDINAEEMVAMLYREYQI